MARKKTPNPTSNPVTYIVQISTYSAEYLRSLGDQFNDGPYSRTFGLIVEGTIKHTTSKKVSEGTPVKLHFISSDYELDPKHPPIAVGSLSSYKDGIHGHLSVESKDAHYLLSILATGKAEALDLFGSEMFRRQSKLLSFRLTTSFEWQEWEATTN